MSRISRSGTDAPAEREHEAPGEGSAYSAQRTSEPRPPPRREVGVARSENFDAQIRVVASVAVLRGRKVLLIREREEPYNGLWVLPQGYVKRGETVGDAAKREAREELGVEVELDGLAGVYDDFASDGPWPLHYVIVVYRGALRGSAEPLPTREAIDSVWMDVSRGLPEVPQVIRTVLRDVARAGGRRGRAGW